ncbi:MAG TPA: hypothetical protein VNG33_03650, partial [Polyangiaceae bacterium]|nr:hypothetical protein [Polyangiaceae bacterium]
CSAQVVTAAGAVSCSPYEVLTPGCFAPPSQNGRYAPVAAWATDAYPSHTLRGGRRSFYSAGYFRESSAGWVASPYCTPDGPFQVLAFDEESSVTASRGALGGTWELRINGTPLGDGLPTLPTRAAVSAATLILDDDYYVRDGADWSPLAHALPWTSAKVVGLGSDRFARFVDETGDTELTRRMGATWVAFGHVPATDDASMTPEGVTPARIAINSHNGASVYKQDQADWVLEKSFAPGTVPSLGSRAGVTTLVMPDASGVHVLSPDDNWQETDLIPLSGAQALASDGVVIVESTDPSYLAKLPELSAGRPLVSLVVVYVTVE